MCFPYGTEIENDRAFILELHVKNEDSVQTKGGCCLPFYFQWKFDMERGSDGQSDENRKKNWG